MSRAPWVGVNLPRAIGVGSFGALVNLAAIRLTQALGVRAGAGGLAQLVLAQLRAGGLRLPPQLGPVEASLFHVGVGIGAAIAYALVGAALLPGSKVARGLAFVQPMWLAQALIVLPWLGHGRFGVRLGPWTPLWSFALNALFGLVLGLGYAPRRQTTGADPSRSIGG
ncbi:MAG: hypothetical protein ACYCWW_07030 [Deltaproteobacteria bacterium]